MYIESIELKNFRNYDELNLEFNKNVNFIIGNNAQGKTNLLEGIFMSSIGKSFRTSKDAEMIMFNKDFCKIKVKAQKEYFPIEVEILIKKDQGKNIKVDGVSVTKTSDLLENIYIVYRLWTLEDYALNEEAKRIIEALQSHYQLNDDMVETIIKEKHINDIINMTTSNKPNYIINLPKNYIAKKEYNKISNYFSCLFFQLYLKFEVI